MNVVYYYRSTSAQVLKAYRDDTMAAARIETVAGHFAKQFGAVPLFTVGYDSHFVGITFDMLHPCRWPKLFTKRSDAMPLQVLISESKVTSQYLQLYTQLKLQWEKTWPTEEAKPRQSALLAALGILREDVQDQEMIFLDRGKEAFIAVTFPLYNSHIDEITASRYMQAQQKEKANG